MEPRTREGLDDALKPNMDTPAALGMVIVGGERGGAGGKGYYQMARCLALVSPPHAHSILSRRPALSPWRFLHPSSLPVYLVRGY